MQKRSDSYRRKIDETNTNIEWLTIIFIEKVTSKIPRIFLAEREPFFIILSSLSPQKHRVYTVRINIFLDDRDSLGGQTGLFIRTYKRNQRPGEVNHPFKSRVSPGYCMQIGIAVE